MTPEEKAVIDAAIEWHWERVDNQSLADLVSDLIESRTPAAEWTPARSVAASPPRPAR